VGGAALRGNATPPGARSVLRVTIQL
jgi:hypothetical protein